MFPESPTGVVSGVDVVEVGGGGGGGGGGSDVGVDSSVVDVEVGVEDVLVVVGVLEEVDEGVKPSNKFAPVALLSVNELVDEEVTDVDVRGVDVCTISVLLLL